MVGGGNAQPRRLFKNSKAVENMVITVKNVLTSMLHEPRALALHDISHHTERAISPSSFYSDEGRHTSHSEPMIDARPLTNHTMCVRARTFKLSGSSIRVTVCLYRSTPIVDIRRWENGVAEPTLKPVVLTAREYFGFSNQHDSIVRQIHDLEDRRLNQFQDVFSERTGAASSDDSTVHVEEVATR